VCSPMHLSVAWSKPNVLAAASQHTMQSQTSAAWITNIMAHTKGVLSAKVLTRCVLRPSRNVRLLEVCVVDRALQVAWGVYFQVMLWVACCQPAALACRR
jgi:hypothetical protein